jgi:hypothetical protein
MLRELVEQGHDVSLLISGNSMLPFLIHNRDTIYFRQPERPLQVGDMVFYQRLDGDYIMHRICRITDEGIFTVGDAQQLIEGPLAPEQIFARITAVRRKGKLVKPGNFWWEFFEHIWIRLIPWRHGIMKLYGVNFQPRKGENHDTEK